MTPDEAIVYMGVQTKSADADYLTKEIMQLR